MPIDLSALSFLLQISDSAFPTGGYAHSYGLEEMARCGVVHDAGSLKNFLLKHVRPGLENMDLPLLRDAHQAAAENRFEDILELDQLANALKLSFEQRDASRRTGGRRLAIALKLHSNPAVEALKEAISAGKAEGHHTIVFACICRDLPIRDCLAAYDYQAISGYCISAMKLLRVGQESVQRVLTDCLADSAGMIERSLLVTKEEIGWFDPVVDLACMHHEIANERLFIS